MELISSKSNSTAVRASVAADIVHSTPIDMSGLMVSTPEVKKKVSMTYATDANGQPIGLPLDLFLFSDSIKISNEYNPNSVKEFSTNHEQPETKQFPNFESGKMLGYIPLSNEFHMESNRERVGPEDDGLDDEDLTAADGIVRKKKVQVIKRRSIIYDNIRTNKGEFIFPYRTYRPKVQVAYSVPAGQVPQGVLVERLHRLYKKTDINLVLQTLGIEPSDLIPPPNYCETNERFYQEMTFRSRVRVNGVFKKDFILHGGQKEEQEEHHLRHLHAPKDEDSVSYASTSSSSHAPETHSSSETVKSKSESEEGVEEEETEANKDQEDHHHHHHHHHEHYDEIHPFIRSKPPFNPMFPLNFFDDEDFDIRTAHDWLNLGWDSKERRFYPLPAKAFLPLPGTLAKKKSQALSETVVDHLLTSTPRLEKLLKWLLQERYLRTVNMFGIDPSKVKYVPTDTELALLARLGTTVPCIFKDSSAIDLLTRSRMLLERKSSIGHSNKLNEDDSSLSLFYLNSLLENNGETSQSNQDPYKPDVIEVDGQSLPLYNIVYKKRPDKCPGMEDDDDDDFEDDEDEDFPVKKDQTLSGEKTVDSSAFPSSEIAEDTENPIVDEEETEAEEIDEDTDDRDYYTGIPLQQYIRGENGPVRPTSPDTDALIEGHEKYVFEYDKMKKVHVYNWQFCDVAVFDYNEKTNRYYVRTIYPPIVHAWVDKIYICFDGEDPTKHGQRIRDAVIRRYESENLMRFNLYLDCLPVEDFPSMADKTMESIVRRCLSSPKIEYSEKSLDRVKEEINLEYKRTMAKTKFINVTERHPKLYKPWVHIPEEKGEFDDAAKEWKKQAVLDLDISISKQNLKYKIKKIQKLSVAFRKEPFEAYKKINEICLEAKRKPLILIDIEPLSLEDWEIIQKANIAEVRRYLKEDWYALVIETLKEQLGKIPQSWYNLNETRYDIFMMSKLSNYLLLIKLVLESTLRGIVTESLERFINKVKEVTKDIDLKKMFKWNNRDDLITSLYPTPQGVSQIWLLDLYLDKTPKCSQMLSNFSKVALEIFSAVINVANGFPALLPQIMPHLQFASATFLNSCDEFEVGFVSMGAELRKYIKRSLLPVDTYVQLYKKYLAVWNVDIPTYINEWESHEQNSDEVRKLVLYYKKKSEQYEKEIPHEIHITGIKLIVEAVREGMLQKMQTFSDSLLDSFALRLKNIILKVREDYAEIEIKLNIRSDDIAEVMELKAFVEVLPDQVKILEEITTEAINNYDIFDEFMYQVPSEDTTAKWQAALSSGRTLRLARQAQKLLEVDRDRLLQVQQSDLSSLSDQVDSAAMSCAGLLGFLELSQAVEVSQKVMKVYKVLKDLQEHGEILNKRQKTFNLPLLQNTALEKLIQDIEPFKDLWLVAADWLLFQESLFGGGPLEAVDIDALVRCIDEGEEIINRNISYFEDEDMDQIEFIASTIKYQMDQFRPLVPLIRTLKNKGMRQRHWDRVSEICGFVIEFQEMNFKDLQDQGINAHAKEITEIGDLATREYEIELSLDKMAEEMILHQVKLDIEPLTNQPVISVAEDAMLKVDEYIEETNGILENPYNKPFEERLTIWDKNIKRTKNNMEIWFSIQHEWLVLEPTFKVPDIQTRLPVEFKMFEKMQRIWRRLIRCARNNHLLLELASDTTVMASIHQFKDLIENMSKALQEHKAPKAADEDSDD